MQAQAAGPPRPRRRTPALVERASALARRGRRLEEAARELETRVRRGAPTICAATRPATQELRDGDRRRRSARSTRACVRSTSCASACGRPTTRRGSARAVRRAGGRIREARRVARNVRAEAAQLDVARATAEADLTHLAATCVETVQATLDEVAAEVEELETSGALASPRPVDDAPEPAEVEDEADAGPDSRRRAPRRRHRQRSAAMTADEMVADLRAKIERLGAVNMMAIEQFDELESRHAFLTTQRKDLVDSIAATSEAIKRIDETTKERFREAFTAINQNFQETFSTLFGGGRAGLVAARRERSARERHRHHRAAARQAAAERAAAVGRREGADRDRADVRDLQVQAEPVLPARRDRRAARRCEHRAVRRDAAGHAGRTRSSSSSRTTARRWRSPTGSTA